MDLRRVLETTQPLPRDVRAEIVSLGECAVPFLLRVLRDESDGEPARTAAGHAARLLADLRADAAVETLVRRLPIAHIDDVELENALLAALAAFGERSVAPLLRALEKESVPSARHVMCEALSMLRVRDDRIERHLLCLLDEEPTLGGMLYGDYAGERAVPRLLAKLEELMPRGRSEYEDINELANELQRLGAVLSPELAAAVRQLRVACGHPRPDGGVD